MPGPAYADRCAQCAELVLRVVVHGRSYETP